MMDDVVINKIATIERCLQRIRTVYAESGDQFVVDYNRQDSVILNLQRACQASIDLANHICHRNKLGVPQSSRDSFELLHQAKFLSTTVTTHLKKMVGLRNIAVHDYQTLNLEIVQHVIEHHLQDFTDFCTEINALSIE